MAHSHVSRDRPVLARAGTLVAACSVALTLALLGVVAFATGNATGAGDRIAFYVLGGAVTFASALFVLDRRERDGRDLLVVSAGLAVLAFVLLTLGTEGTAYALRQPGEALGSNQPLYLLSAAMYSTGLGYWALNHWREFRRSVRRLR